MQIPTLKQSTIKKLKKLKIKTAKFVAFTVLVIAATYGFRTMLATLQETVQLVLTVIAILSLVFIITLNEE